MNRRIGLLWLALLTVPVAGLSGCAHKPAYQDIETNNSLRNQNQNQNQSAEVQATATTPGESPTPATGPAQPAPATPAPLKTPAFLDPASGGIKDLPAYPNASRVTVSIGPIQGVNTMSLILTTSDQMDKIAAHYTRVIKDNKWTVKDKIIDPEFSEWTLTKGDNNSAKVQIKMDQKTRAFNIVMVRGEKIEDPKK